MRWKIFLVVFISLFCICFPGNIIGCGPESDPYDEYTSFFLNDLSPAKAYEPFYYINELFLYDDNEPVDASHATSAEWVGYCGNKGSDNDAYDFVCRYDRHLLAAMYASIEKHQDKPLPDSVAHNSIAQYFVRSRDLEALGYLMFAKQVEPNVTGTWNEWDTKKRDSLLMSRQIADGKQLYAAAKNQFIKLRYAYQLTRLALYSGNNNDCIRYYDEMMQTNNTASILQELGLSLKAGALFRTGRKNEAALLFSKEFSKSPVKRVANYMSFDWCVKRFDADNRKACLSLCKDDVEKANMLGLFAFGSNVSEESTLKTIYHLAPSSEMLEVLAIREVNKIEEKYFSPGLRKEKGGRKIYDLWPDIPQEAISVDPESSSSEARSLSMFYDTISKNPLVSNKALFETAAAYLSYVVEEYADAKKYLNNAVLLKPSKKITDEIALTRLLVTLNESPQMDSTFEAALLPSVKWLAEKASDEKDSANSYSFGQWSSGPWHKLYRNLFSETIAKKYHRQKDFRKEILSVGCGEAMGHGDYITKDLVQNQMTTKDLLAIDKLLNSARRTAWDDYLATHFPVQKTEVREAIIVSHVRDFQFSIALKSMFGVAGRKAVKLDRNPFADLLMDYYDSSFSFDHGHFDNIKFLRTMADLKKKEAAGQASAADLYKLALGLYNITYYGRAWQVVRSYRSGADGYAIPKDALPYEREYYGCFTAEKYFNKAMNASTDKEQKARCLFMIAKCAQKRFKSDLEFHYSKYFPQLVKAYKDTKFYQEAYNTCSYLRDFVKRQ